MLLALVTVSLSCAPAQVLMAELLPVLEARPFLEGSVGLLRAIHTQLCEGGRRFPVLVRDELLD